MKTNIRHVCQAGSAPIRLESLFDTGITEIADDCSTGPLADVDTATPVQRSTFWHDCFTLAYGDAGPNWTTVFQGVHQQLSSLSHDTDEIVIWSGTHPVEQLLRRRVYWWLRNSTTKVTEVLIDTRDMDNPGERPYAAVAQIATERLKMRFAERQSIPPALRQQLADEWVTLRDQGTGIRLIEKNVLVERPIVYFDNDLLSFVGEQPVQLSRTIGQAMSETGMGDTFCKWRYVTLIQRGELTLISGSLHDEYNSAMIGKPGRH
ncbi:DUF3658 domain-containing protein [Enterobacter kobei]|uniref:DUF3658 domain-containing protein n=1 Tax=Enterobacter kobei TaxID=208224 RepID=UPI003CEB6536